MPETFAAEIEAFLKEERMDAATLGRRALNDPNFVFDVRSGGRCPNLRTIERIRRFMKECADAGGGGTGPLD